MFQSSQKLGEVENLTIFQTCLITLYIVLETFLDYVKLLF
mgnify:CR=1 FL=1